MVYSPFGREERKAVARGPLAIQYLQLYAGQKRRGQGFHSVGTDQIKRKSKKRNPVVIRKNVNFIELSNSTSKRLSS